MLKNTNRKEVSDESLLGSYVSYRLRRLRPVPLGARSAGGAGPGGSGGQGIAGIEGGGKDGVFLPRYGTDKFQGSGVQKAVLHFVSGYVDHYTIGP